MFNSKKMNIIKFLEPNADKHRIRLVFFATLVAALYTFSVVMKVSIGLSDSVVMKVSIGLSDFVAHAKVAEDMLRGEKCPPHFLYQLLLIGTHSLFKVSFIHASFITVFTIVFITFVIVYKNMCDKKVILNKSFLIFTTCFLLLSHPITILFPYDKHLYYGYIASNVYHNPSILLLKVIALLHFVLLCKLLTNKEYNRHLYIHILLLALLTILTIIAKPNYIIALLPSLVILFLIKQAFRGDTTYWLCIVAWGVVIPAFGILIWQYIFFYGSGNKNSIGIGIFEIFEINSQLWTLVPKLLVSITFPISVIIVMKSQLMQKLDFQISAIMFAIALVYSYLLVDKVGTQGVAAGNFWWSAQIASFLFLFVCSKFYLSFIFNTEQQYTPQVTKIIYLPVYVGFTQFIFGITWYITNIVPSFWMP